MIKGKHILGIIRHGERADWAPKSANLVVKNIFDPPLSPKGIQ
jgi:hypothetical protein